MQRSRASMKVWHVQVVQDFQQPEGTSKEEMDAAGDGEVLVVLDLR